MRRSADDPAIIEQRILNEAGDFEWIPITDDMSDWVSVKGVLTVDEEARDLLRVR